LEPFTIRHGQGYSTYEHAAHGIRTRLLVTIAADEPVKFLRLELVNESNEQRTLSVWYCVEWVLGVTRDITQLHVNTAIEPLSGAMLATNHFNQEFTTRVAFVQVVGRDRTVTADRREFFGRNGGWGHPAALDRSELSGRVGAGFDPCGAIQTTVALAPGEKTEVIFLLGQGADRAATEALLERYGRREAVDAAIEATRATWNDMLDRVEVRTPNRALDLLVNRWLPYQILACRFWGRTAFYQSGGAYGYRDQLQDSMALVYARPDLARAHILLAASRQFVEGDVQHWWHPPSGRGVRTRYSDDMLWLALATAHYVEVTGDRAILDEQVSYLQSAPLKPDEHERYEQPEQAPHGDTLYRHCLAAIERGSHLGQHGLPLMGCGDWNDGMNKVGEHGQGESVWNAWFLRVILQRFAPLVATAGETKRAEELRGRAEALRESVEQHAWDGEWYRRAYFDDGTPLGSKSNDACRIDSLTQSWAVIAGGQPDRARQAMQAVYEQLVRSDDQLILLFWPPFDHSTLDPGYIQGYLPGVRENGGQYTHAAMWVVQAAALLGDGNRAMRLFDLLAPPRHADSETKVGTYKVEPYVLAADVYGQPPHTGCGGWTWYTGSAGWMYRVALENLLGLEVQAGAIRLHPCIPTDWPRFEMTYRQGKTAWHIVVENPRHVSTGVTRVSVDDGDRPDHDIPLTDDGQSHEVRVELG
jgi:cyclic beta-1,2-glucan synthetase